MLARHIDTGHLAIMVEHRAVMRCDDVILFVDSGVWALALAAQRRHHLAEQPRPAIGAAAHHHPLGAALREPGARVRRRTNIPRDTHPAPPPLPAPADEPPNAT